MSKKLKFGDIITYKNGTKAIYSGDNTVVFDDGVVGGKVYWKEVHEVERYVQLYNFHDHGITIPMNYYSLKTIYEAKEILDEVEKEYLSNLLKPFKNRVKGITKCSKDNNGKEFILIELKTRGDDIFLPYFKKGIMYKGMKLDKEYTLKELGLED